MDTAFPPTVHMHADPRRRSRASIRCRVARSRRRVNLPTRADRPGAQAARARWRGGSRRQSIPPHAEPVGSRTRSGSSASWPHAAPSSPRCRRTCARRLLHGVPDAPARRSGCRRRADGARTARGAVCHGRRRRAGPGGRLVPPSRPPDDQAAAHVADRRRARSVGQDHATERDRMALCVYGDAGWGREVQRGKDVDGAFSRGARRRLGRAIRDRWRPAAGARLGHGPPVGRDSRASSTRSRGRWPRELGLPYVECSPSVPAPRRRDDAEQHAAARRNAIDDKLGVVDGGRAARARSCSSTTSSTRAGR